MNPLNKNILYAHGGYGRFRKIGQGYDYYGYLQRTVLTAVNADTSPSPQAFGLILLATLPPFYKTQVS